MNTTDDKYVIPVPEAGRAYGLGAGTTHAIFRDNNIPVQRRANRRDFTNIPGFQKFGQLAELRTK